MLHGTIPPSIFTLPQIQNIDLDDNVLTGGLPENYSTTIEYMFAFLSLFKSFLKY